MKNLRQRKIWIILISVLVLCLVAGAALLVLHFEQQAQEQLEHQEQYRDDAIAELERGEGTYDAQSIVLYNTSRAKAEELAEKLGASLRMTKDGSFATLTLPEGTTILDVYRDEDNLAYLEQMSADYQVSISELTEGEEGEEEQDNTRLPMRPTYEVSDTDYEMQTYLDYMNMQNVWASYTGYGITVAVIDTGIDTDHPEFAGRISEYSYNATEDKIVKDYLLEDGSYDWSLVEDEQGHGTAVTGVIAASMNSGNVVGIAPDVTIITIKAQCDEQGNFKRTSDLVFGLYYAIERDVSVVNMSFGGPEDVFGEATQLAYDSDVICVAAAGNDSTAALTWPAADPLVIGVGALADGSWELAEYSNYGENVNVVAPGTTYTSLMGGGYGSMDGTSLACPTVTGLIALYMQTHKYVMFDQVTEELYASSFDLGDLGCDWYYGFGAVDANAFLIEERGTVTYDMLTDEVDDMEGTFIRGHALQVLPEPDRLYAVFDGWYYDEHCTQRVEYYTDAFYGDLTLYASWVNEDDGIPFTYVILDDGTVEIRSYTGHRRFITVPEKIEGRVVSSIGDFAFAGETNLREVGLPSGLRHIGLSAFEGCSNLVSMYIPENVTEIESSAFAECVRLSTVAFTGQSKLLTVGNNAFFACGKLRTIELPASLQSINGTAFVGTSALTAIRVQSGNQYFKSEDGVLFNISGEILVAYPAAHGTTYEIPSSVKTVGDYAFYGAKVIFLDFGQIQTIGSSAFAKSSVLTVNIPDSVTYMGSYAFEKSAVRELTIGAGLTDIAVGAFTGCASLRSVHIPEGIIAVNQAAFQGSGLQEITFGENSQLYGIDDLAFAACQLTEIEIPASVEHIGFAGQATHDPDYYSPMKPAGAFDLNPLTSVTFAKNSQLQVIGDRAFAYTKLQSIDLPEGLEMIGAGAFWTTPLETVMLPASLTVLEEAAFGYLPAWSASQLTAITVTEGNPVYHDVDGVVYNLSNTEIYAFPAGRGGEYTVLDTVRKVMPYSFAGATYLERVMLPEGLTEIGNYAFAYSGCYTYDLPSTLRYIKNGGFYSNFRLNSITLPEGLEQISECAFYGCGVLPTIHIPDSVLQIGRYSFAECWSLSSVTFNETAKLPRISFAAFAYCGLQSFRVPANVSTMAQKAFEGCYKLTSFTFAENSKLESISAYMFNGCSNLQTITFESGSALTSVQAHGLEGMDKLTQINWGDAKVTNIDNFAFRFCESLSELTLPETVVNVGRYAFYGCKSLSELTLPANIEHIGSFAFLGTGDLNLYLSADTMPAYLDEDWDHGIRGYYVGVTSVETQGDYKYATLTSGDVSIIEYLGNDTELDLSVLDFGAPITAIGGSAFEDMGITRVILPDTLISIQAEAFAYNPLQEITIPAGVTFIGREAFTYTEIASLTFAEGSQIATIEQYAFERTRNLTEVTLPASLTTMGRGVFQESGLTNVTFEEGIALERIPQNAFTETKLTSITLPDSVNYIDHNAFMEIPTLQSVTFGSAENISLQSNSFYHTGLTSLHIPANVTYIGEYSFVALSNLTEITVDENNPYYKSEDGLLLSKNGRKLIVVPAGRTGSLTVPTSVEMLGFGTFEESKLSEVKFDPNANILTLGYRAFFKANNITSINIPKSVISIDYYAFAYCENLHTVNFAEDNQLKGIYEGAFLGDINLENITIPDTIVEISDFAFYGCSKIDRIPMSENGIVKGIYSYAFAYTGIEGEFTTPETLIDIGDYAFLGTKITKLTVPDTNQWDLIIGIGAFEDCYKLEEVTLPFIGASLDDMDRSWFGYIFGAGAYEANNTYVPDSLKTVTITEGQTLVGKGGFAYLTGVETLNIPHSICTLYNDAFKDTTALHELTNTIMTWYGNGYALSPHAMPGHFGSGLTGQLELAGSGVMSNNNWTDGVKTICERAFRGCSELTCVIIPNSVTNIGPFAFERCTSLVSITIPDGVESISQEAFGACDNLTEIIIDESNDCFEVVDGILYNKQLGKKIYILEIDGPITIPDYVTCIENNSFDGCTDLTSITIPENVTVIGERAFSGCTNLTSITIPENVTVIGESAFSGCTNLTDVIMMDGVSSIGGGAFSHCRNLRTIVIPDSVTYIGNNAFFDCTGLVSASIGSSVESIDYGAFTGCYGLYFVKNYSDIHVTIGADDNGNIGKYAKVLVDKNSMVSNAPDGAYTIDEDGFLYGVTDGMYRLYAYMGSEETITLPLMIEENEYVMNGFYSTAKHVILPNGINTIDAHMFENSGGWSSITIPGSVKTIEDSAFAYCYNLVSITISDGVVDIGENAFDFCSNLSSVTIPGSVTSIGRNAFRCCDNLTEVVIPDGVTSIGSGAFLGCGLQSITIPGSVTSIGWNAFLSCHELTHITVSETNKHFEVFDGVLYDKENGLIEFAPRSIQGSITIPHYVKRIDSQTFIECTDLTSVTIPGSVVEIGPNAFLPTVELVFVDESSQFTVVDGVLYDGSLTKLIRVLDTTISHVEIPNGVKNICDSAFANCTNLAEVIIPNSVTNIGACAFENCTNLVEVIIPDGVVRIGYSAFRGCSEITDITIPDSVTHIDGAAFSGCSGLLTATLSNSITRITPSTFKDCTALTSIIIPNGVTVIDDSAFYNCISLKHIALPDGVKKIGWWAFYKCSNLASVEIPNSVMSIGVRAFSQCDNLIVVDLPESINDIGLSAFSGCDALACITVDENNSCYYSSGNCLIAKDTKEVLFGFSNSVIPDDGSILGIGEGAFLECAGLTCITIPDSVVSIGRSAFKGCSNLASVTIGANVDSIGSDAFTECSIWHVVNRSKLNITIGSSDHGAVASMAGVIVDKEGNYSYASNETYFSTEDNYFYQIIDGVYVLRAYYGEEQTIILPNRIDGHEYQIREFKTTAPHIIIPEGMTQINALAFMRSNIQSITLSNSVMSIGVRAFQDCTNLRSIIIPEGVVSIGEAAFYYCTGLTNITIPDSVTDIGNSAFGGCTGLSSVTIPNSVSFTGWATFQGCIGLTEVIISEGVTAIGESAFSGCSELKSVIIPDSVTIIQEYAFWGCTNLTNISIPQKRIFIAEDALTNTGYYNDPSNWENGVLILDNWLIEVNSNIEYHCFDNVRFATAGAYADCQRLKIAIWGGGLKGATNLETLIIKGIGNTGEINHPHITNAKLPITLKNIIIPQDVDLDDLRNNIEFLQYVSGVTIYVEGNEKDLRWNDNFPGWNNENRVVYGDNWSWLTFYDEQGNIISMEPRRNEQIIRKPVYEIKDDVVNSYKLIGWDIDGDGIADSVPAASVSDLEAHPVYNTIPKEYVIVFKDSETGEIYKQETLHYGDPIITPVTPTREDGFLIGWMGYTESITVIGDAEFLTNWHVHDIGEWYQTIAPTCTTEGENRRDCKRCDYFETEVVAALGHTPAATVIENRIEPTCTEIGGYDEVVYCSVCGAELSREHKVLEALGHSHDAVVTAPTCTEQGYTTHTCHCGDVYVDSYMNALGHTEVVNEAVAPTCTETGLAEGKHCSVCNEVLIAQELVPATGHTYESVVTAPTCTEQGYTTHTCHCGDSYVDSEVDALGHTPSDWIVDIEAQIGVEGSKHKECTVCGETLETGVIEALPVETDAETETEAPTEADSKQEDQKPSNGCSSNVNANVFFVVVLVAISTLFFVKRRKENC